MQNILKKVPLEKRIQEITNYDSPFCRNLAICLRLYDNIYQDLLSSSKIKQVVVWLLTDKFDISVDDLEKLYQQLRRDKYFY